MTTRTVYNLPNGDIAEVHTNVGATPMVFLNGVLQQPGSYSISGTNVIFDIKQKPWEWVPVTILWPRKINGRWYWPGSKVYRYYTLSPGGGFWRYGDEFDILKDS